MPAVPTRCAGGPRPQRLARGACLCVRMDDDESGIARGFRAERGTDAGDWMPVIVSAHFGRGPDGLVSRKLAEAW